MPEWAVFERRKMPVGERIKRQLKEKEIREEQERLQCIHTINETSRELNQRALKEAEPYLEVLRRAGIYEIFREMRRTLKLEWTSSNPDKKTDEWGREYGGCLWAIGFCISAIRGVTDPALITTRIKSKEGGALKISEQGRVDGGFGLENNRTIEGLRIRAAHLASIKEITINEVSLELKWAYELHIDYGGQRGESSYESERWDLLETTVTRDSKSGLFIIDLNAGSTYYGCARARLTPSEWQDRKKVEEVVAKVYLEAFPQ